MRLQRLFISKVVIYWIMLYEIARPAVKTLDSPKIYGSTLDAGGGLVNVRTLITHTHTHTHYPNMNENNNKTTMYPPPIHLFP